MTKKKSLFKIIFSRFTEERSTDFIVSLLKKRIFCQLHDFCSSAKHKEESFNSFLSMQWRTCEPITYKFSSLTNTTFQNKSKAIKSIKQLGLSIISIFLSNYYI